MVEMSENLVSFIDSTLQLKWELTKENFDNCAFLEYIDSQMYTVQIGSEQSNWVISICPKGDEVTKRDQVAIGLRLLGNQIYNVLFDFRLETSSGYWPNDFVEKLFSKRCTDDFMEFDPSETNSESNNSWHFRFSSTEEFCQQFVDDKATIVAILRIDMGARDYRNHMELTDEFTNDMRSMSLLDADMYDFTLICDGQHFPCHKNVLASRSEFFRGLFRHKKDKKEMEVHDSSPEIVKIVLDFMANGLLPKDIDAKAKEVIHLADMYGLKGLTDACIVSLVKNLSPENATETLTIVDEHAPNSEQRSKILEYIKKEASQVVKTQHWKTFMQNYPNLVTDIVLTPYPCTHKV